MGIFQYAKDKRRNLLKIQKPPPPKPAPEKKPKPSAR